jgi:lipoprotein-releasing system ATP-binding protein
MGLAGADRILKLMDAKPEEDDGYVTLVNAEIDENGNLTETDKRTGKWAWKHPHSDGTLTYTELKGDVRLLDVDFGYNEEKNVLNGLSMDFKSGEVTAIVGKSGAGKTTLLQIIGTLDTPDSGKLYINGTETVALSEKKLAAFRNQNIGFVFQFHQLLPEFTALENVMIPALIAKEKTASAEKRAKEILDFLNLKDRMSHKPNELSGGEKQRVAVARALINNPAVILADEPSGSLDTQNKEELHKLFFDLRDQMNQTFVIVTHDEQLATDTDRVIHIKDGRTINC